MTANEFLSATQGSQARSGRFNFIGGTYTLQSANIDAQVTLNMFPQIDESGSGKNRVALVGTPGLSAPIWTLPQTPVRALWAGENRLWAVAGNMLYELLADGTYATAGISPSSTPGGGLAPIVGTVLAVDGNPAIIIPSANNLLIISGGQACYDNGAGIAACLFVDGTGTGLAHPFVGATMGTFLDGYFIVSGSALNSGPSGDQAQGKRQINISGGEGVTLDDPTVWSVLDFAIKEAYPDNIAAILADHEELWIWGDTSSTEVWQNTGVNNFPLQRMPGAFIHHAALAAWGAVRLGEGIAYLGGDVGRGGPVFYYAQGFYPQRLSNFAVEQVWGTYARWDDAVAYVYIDQGHEFYVVTFPTANATWCLDMSTGQWHQRGWWNGTSNDRQRGWVHAAVALAAHGSATVESPFTHYVGDWQNGNVYKMSTAYLTDNGAPIQRIRTAPHLSDDQLYNYYSRFQIDVDTIDPLATLSWSNTNGISFNTGITASSAVLSDDPRQVWRRMGKGRDRVYSFTSSAAIKQVWTNAYLEVAGGTA
jgi:hypothetical protein